MTIYLKPDRRDEAQEFFVSYLENRAKRKKAPLASPLATLKLQAQDDPERSAYLSAIEGIILYMKGRKDGQEAAAKALACITSQLIKAGLDDIQARGGAQKDDGGVEVEASEVNLNRPLQTTSRVGITNWKASHFDARGRGLPTGSFDTITSKDGKSTKILRHRYKALGPQVTYPPIPEDEFDEFEKLVKSRYILLLISHHAAVERDTMCEAVDDAMQYWVETLDRSPFGAAYGALGAGYTVPSALFIAWDPKDRGMYNNIYGFAGTREKTMIQMKIAPSSIVISEWPEPVADPVEPVRRNPDYQAKIDAALSKPIGHPGRMIDGYPVETHIEKGNVLIGALQWIVNKGLRSDPKDPEKVFDRADAVVAEFRRIKYGLKRNGGIYPIMQPRKAAFRQAIGYARALITGGGSQVKPFHVHINTATTSIQVNPSYPFPGEIGEACKEWSRLYGGRKGGNADGTNYTKELRSGVRYITKAEGLGPERVPPLMGDVVAKTNDLLGAVELGAFAMAGYKLFYEAHLASPNQNTHFVPQSAFTANCDGNNREIHVCPVCCQQGTCVLFVPTLEGLLCLGCVAKAGDTQRTTDPLKKAVQTVGIRLARDTARVKGAKISRYFVQPSLAEIKDHVVSQKDSIDPRLLSPAQNVRSAMSLACQQIELVCTLKLDDVLRTTMLAPTNLRLNSLASSLFGGSHGRELQEVMARAVRRTLLLKPEDRVQLSCLVRGEQKNGVWQYPSEGQAVTSEAALPNNPVGRAMLEDWVIIKRLSSVEKEYPWLRLERMKASPAEIQRIEEQKKNVLEQVGDAQAFSILPPHLRYGQGQQPTRTVAAPVSSIALTLFQRNRKDRFISGARRITLAITGGRYWLPTTPDGVPFFLLGEDASRWNFAKIERYLIERHQRKCETCDWEHNTDLESSPEGMYAVAVIRALRGHGIDNEVLGMPLVADTRSPLSSSFGHRVHGRAMTCGLMPGSNGKLLTREGTALGVNVDEDDINIDLEAVATNRARSNFADVEEWLGYEAGLPGHMVPRTKVRAPEDLASMQQLVHQASAAFLGAQ